MPICTARFRTVHRLVAVALACGLFNPPAPAQTRPVASVDAAVTQLPHISVQAIGKGAPVVLIPGLSMSRENWRETAQRLAATHRVHLVQINGFGGSEPGINAQPGLLNGVVEDLSAYLRQQKIPQAAIVGHSLGGTLGLMFAKAHSAQVSRLLIVDALPWVALIMAPPTATVAQIEPQAKAMRDMMLARAAQPIDEAQARAQVAMLALKPASQEAAWQWSKAADRRVTAEAFYEDMLADLRADMPALNMPITLLYPWAATGPSKESADALYRAAYARVSNMTFVDVPDSGHFIMLDQPVAFNAALDTFLKN
jgi:pimeloyl-ACP methyl ester carboxylesterase